MSAVAVTPRIRCKPPVLAIDKYERDYQSTFFAWETIECLLDDKPTAIRRFERWNRHGTIELQYYPVKTTKDVWISFMIRPWDNGHWERIWIRNGSPIEMEFFECLPHDDGFEDCKVCGYTHHYEDKCPTGKQCAMYKMSFKEVKDDHGVRCAYIGGDKEYVPVEPHCVECGYVPNECSCDEYVPAAYWSLEAKMWVKEE